VIDPAPTASIVRDLAALGVRPGSTLLVHTSFSRVGPVEGGPAGLVAALRTALGAAGTLVMPSMTEDDGRVFDAKSTPCTGMGVVADTFWRLPGVLRSDSPHAFAAIGPNAARVVAPHPIDPPHGRDSPIGRVHDVDGDVLLLGAGHDANTTIHLAENLAGVRYRRVHHVTVLRDGRPTRLDYLEIDHCCRRFALADDWLDACGLQRRARVGRAEARLVRSRDVVEVVTARLAADETVFLDPPGTDAECDDAWASLAAGARPDPDGRAAC
jgi:aminoglycoside N3'-acetyltransferase